MDIPLKIEEATGFIVGKEELQQTILLLLKNAYLTFLQKATLGARYSIHADEDLVEIGVRDTLKQIPGLTVEGMTINLPQVDIKISYNGDVEQFQFNLDENEN